MAKSEERLRARQLRGEGLSIISIAQELKVSKSTASIWCRDISLTKRQLDQLAQNKFRGGYIGSLKGAQANREKKEKLIEFYKNEAKKEIGKLSNRDVLLIGISLYWAEGSKENKFVFTNSDPQMILLMKKWLMKIGGTQKDEFIPRIYINEIHESRLDQVLKFWTDLLDLPVEQFRKTAITKHEQKKIYDNYNSYYGILALKVRNSTSLKYRISGLIEAIISDEADVAQLVRASHS